MPPPWRHARPPPRVRDCVLCLQLLVQVGQVSQRALHKHEKEAREAGKASFFLAWVSGAACSLVGCDAARRVHMPCGGSGVLLYILTTAVW